MAASDSGSVPAPGRRSWLMPLAVSCFLAGVLLLLVVLGLYLSGQSDLPWWLNIGAFALTSAGFALGLIALLREARSG